MRAALVLVFTLSVSSRRMDHDMNIRDEVCTHPPAYTLNDEAAEGILVLPFVEPFEMSNPSHVAGRELYQSDMLLSKGQWEALMGTRKALDDTRMRWTEGSDGYPLVPYVFQDSVNQDDVRAGLDHWKEHTCIKFEETSDIERPYLQFHIGKGCWSYIGMHFWRNGQKISIGHNCNEINNCAPIVFTS